MFDKTEIIANTHKYQHHQKGHQNKNTDLVTSRNISFLFILNPQMIWPLLTSEQSFFSPYMN